MICEVCREEVATVHLTEIVNNTKKEIHLCETCAQKKGVAIHSHVKNVSIPEFFGQLTQEVSEPKCPQCGIDFGEFRNSGKLGCPHDFEVFRDEIEELLEKIHGSTQHRGKVPSRVNTLIRRQKELEDLRTELSSAVEREEYEHAAEIRDRIHNLEREENCS